MVYCSPQVQIYGKGLKRKTFQTWSRLIGGEEANLSELKGNDLNGYVDNGLRLLRELPDVVSIVDPLYLSDIDVGYCSTMIRPVVRGLGEVYRNKSVQVMPDPFSKNTLIYFHFAADDMYLQSGYSYEAFAKLEGAMDIFVGHTEAVASFIVTKEGIPIFMNFKIVEFQDVQVCGATGLPNHLNWLTVLALKAILLWKHNPIRNYIQRFGQECLSYAMKQGIKDLLLLMEPLYLPGIYYLRQKIKNSVLIGIHRTTLLDKVKVDLNRKNRCLLVKVRISVRNILYKGQFINDIVSLTNGDFKIGVGQVIVTTVFRISRNKMPEIEDVTIDDMLDIRVIRAVGRGVYSNFLVKSIVNSMVNSIKNTVKTTLQFMIRSYVKRPLSEWANNLFVSLLEVNMKARRENIPQLLDAK